MDPSHRPKVRTPDSTHGHQHTLSEQPYLHRPKARRRLVLAMVLTGVTLVAELTGGIISRSLALLSDAFHMMSHFFALGTSLLALVIASRKVPDRFSFGLYRAEVLSALLNGLGLTLIAFFIIYESVRRLISPEIVETSSMFWIALLGLTVNALTALLLFNVEKHDLNMRGAFFHMLADTASSVGVVLGAVVIGMTGWLWIDPLVSMGIAAVILFWSWGLLRDSVFILLESAPKEIQPDEVAEAIRASFREIQNVHDMHIWEITSHMYSFTAHFGVESSLKVSECESLRDRINTLLDERFHITHTNFQFESAGRDLTV